MRILLLLALLGSPAPKSTADQATKLVQAKNWDDLYLAFSSGDPAGFSPADRQTIGSALLQGAHAMAATDGVVATSLAERSVAFQESTDALLYAAELEQGVQQNGEAAKYLDRAVALDAKSGAAHLARAQLAMKENDAALALKHLDAVPAGFQAAKVKALRTQANAKLAEAKAGAAALDRAQQQATNIQNHAQDQAAPPPSRAGPRVTAVSQRNEVPDGAALAGLREKAGRHFVFAYGNNERDWGQRADYEGEVESALEDAYEFVGETMHTNREQPVTVVLYTKKEYDFHYGGSQLSRAAGFFSGKIRINGAEEMTPEVRATITHEYVHAVLDELLGPRARCRQWVNEGFATYVENLFRERRGMPGADDPWHRTLRGIAIANRLPKLATLNASFLDYPNPRLAYATSGEAMQLLIERYGMETFVQMLRDTEKQGWDKLFAERFTPDLDQLDGEVRSELAR